MGKETNAVEPWAKMFSLAPFETLTVWPLVVLLKSMESKGSPMVRAGRARIDFNHPLAGRTCATSTESSRLSKTVQKVTTLETNTGRDGFEVAFDGDD